MPGMGGGGGGGGGGMVDVLLKYRDLQCRC